MSQAMQKHLHMKLLQLRTLKMSLYTVSLHLKLLYTENQQLRYLYILSQYQKLLYTLKLLLPKNRRGVSVVRICPSKNMLT